MLYKKIKNFLKRLFFKISSKKEIQQMNKNLAGIYVNNIIKDPKFKNEKNLLRFGYKVFSQQDEDGIIDEIFNRIGIGSRKFVEMGLETGVECNTTNLLFQKWSGLWVESNKKNVETIKKNFSNFLNKTLQVHSEKISTTNVNQILSKYFDPNTEIDLLSIDIGVHTFHVLEMIQTVNPRVIITEYNAKYGPIIDWSVEYDQTAEWDNTDYFGASLHSFEKMLKKKDYYLVGCNVTGVNAFFVRKDQLQEKFEKNSTSKFHFIEGRYWLKNAFEKNYKIKIK